jgi:guanylate kinase
MGPPCGEPVLPPLPTLHRYVVLNDDIDRAFAEVRAILAAERLKRERQSGLSGLVRSLLAQA